MPESADPSGSGGARRAEVLAALSISIDLGLGLPMEHVLRSSLVASLLADELDLDAEQRASVYYTNLVLWIGCHADSHEFSRWFGDDLAMRRGSYDLDWRGLPYLTYLLQHTGSGRPPAQRVRMLITLMLTPRARMSALIHSHCLSAGLMADHVGLEPAVGAAVTCAFERWDGSGLPAGRSGEEIPLAARVVQLAELVEVHQRTHGTSGALAMARSRSGGQFDPALVEALGRCRQQLNQLPEQDVWRCALELAPDHDVRIRGAELDALLRALGDFADLKCPFTVGHSRAVAELGSSSGRTTRAVPRRRGPGTPCRVRARPRPDGRAQLGVGEGRRVDRVRPGTDPALPLPDRADPEQGRRSRDRGPARGEPPRTPRRVRLSPRTQRRCAADDPTGAGGCRQLPGLDRAPAAPTGAHRQPGGRPVAGGGRRRTPRRGGCGSGRRGRCRRRPTVPGTGRQDGRFGVPPALPA